MKTIQLTKGYVALVDDEDYERVNAFKWIAMKASRCVYAMSNDTETPRRSVLMHRFIIGCDYQVDHADTDGLNNQRYNLRPATHSQNQANARKHAGSHSSQFKGVSWHRPGRKWQAYIKVNGHQRYLGSFREEFDAAQAYNFAAEEHFGEFARMNVPIT